MPSIRHSRALASRLLRHMYKLPFFFLSILHPLFVLSSFNVENNAFISVVFQESSHWS